MKRRPGPATAEEQAELRALREQADATRREVGDTLAALATRVADADPRKLAGRKAAAAWAAARRAVRRAAARPGLAPAGVTAAIVVVAAVAVFWQHHRRLPARGLGRAHRQQDPGRRSAEERGRPVPFQSAFSQLFTQDVTIAAVVFLLVVMAMLGAALVSRRRRRQGRDPSRRATADRLEIGYAVALTGMVVFLVISGLAANAREFRDPPASAVRVQVTAYQWCWRFHYQGQPVTVTGQCAGGSLPTLVLPAGEPVELDVTSIDVVHAFWLPYLRFKMYAYPDHTNTFTTTLPRTGRWLGRCAQLCGLYHYQMDFYVQVVSPAAFQAFLRAKGGATAGAGP